VLALVCTALFVGALMAVVPKSPSPQETRTVALRNARLSADFYCDRCLRWFNTSPPMTTRNADGSCTTEGTIYVQEIGLSGVNRLRIQMKLRGAYDPGNLPFLPAYEEIPDIASSYFPNDVTSYYWGENYHFTYPSGGQYSIHAHMVGDAASFWDVDRSIDANLGVVGCDGGPDDGTVGIPQPQDDPGPSGGGPTVDPGDGGSGDGGGYPGTRNNDVVT